MRSFRRLVIEPFRADLRVWQAHGWAERPPQGPVAVAVLLLRFAGLRATLLHRIGHWGAAAGIPGLPPVVQALNLALHGIEMPPSVPIGPGFYLAHSTGSVVFALEIGSGVELQGAVTIGQRGESSFPTIHDRVLIGAGARVLGEITLGEGARVGAGAVVLTDVPPAYTAVGVPSRLIPPGTPASQTPPSAAEGARPLAAGVPASEASR